VAAGGVGIERAIAGASDPTSSTPTAVAIATHITTDITTTTSPLYHPFATHLAVDPL